MIFSRPQPAPKKKSLGIRILLGLWRTVRALLVMVGIVSLVTIALAFTAMPWRTYQWLSNDTEKLESYPDCVVILGGGGVPSESGLMRCYYGAEAAKEFPRSWVIVAIPQEDEADGLSSPERMKQELILRGVSVEQIKLEARGRNTREQAVRVARMLGDNYAERQVLLVTSPEHMRRALLTFRKAGMEKVVGRAANAVSVEKDLSYEAEKLGGESRVAIDVGGNMMLRYQFWNNLSYMGAAMREGAALSYYWLRGWI